MWIMHVRERRVVPAPNFKLDQAWDLPGGYCPDLEVTGSAVQISVPSRETGRVGSIRFVSVMILQPHKRRAVSIDLVAAIHKTMRRFCARTMCAALHNFSEYPTWLN